MRVVNHKKQFPHDDSRASIILDTMKLPSNISPLVLLDVKIEDLTVTMSQREATDSREENLDHPWPWPVLKLQSF
jgi:hypothetical protein